MINEAYLIIKTGYEGIEDLYLLSDNKEEVIEEVKQLKSNAIKKEREYIERETKEYGEVFETEEIKLKEINAAADFICVQKWDGQKFDCCCDELGVNPSKPMLR